MAEPFSLAAIGVAATAYKVSKGLLELIADLKDVPSELNGIAEQIKHNAVLLECAVKLIQGHEDLFKDELRNLIRDVSALFANISDLFAKILPKSRHRKRDKFKMRILVLWSSKKIWELMAKLEALRGTTTLILNVAQLAEQRALR